MQKWYSQVNSTELIGKAVDVATMIKVILVPLDSLCPILQSHFSKLPLIQC